MCISAGNSMYHFVMVFTKSASYALNIDIIFNACEINDYLDIFLYSSNESEKNCKGYLNYLNELILFLVLNVQLELLVRSMISCASLNLDCTS